MTMSAVGVALVALVFLVETPWWTSVVFVMEIIQPVPIVMMSPMVEPN